MNGQEPHGTLLHLSKRNIRRLVAILCIVSANAASVADTPPKSNASVDAAFAWLNRQMDQYNTSVVVVDEPEYQAFFPSFFGDYKTLRAGYVSDATARSGRHSLKIEYRPRPDDQENWAGVFFLYPRLSPNGTEKLGVLPGRNLVGASRLRFWARADHQTTVRFGAGLSLANKPTDAKFWNSFGEKDRAPDTLTEKWQQFSIDLSGADLSSVMDGLFVAFNQDNRRDPATIYLDDARFDVSLLDEPRFLQSYMPCGCDVMIMTNSVYVYDQALVLLAYLARGNADDLRRAELIAGALLTVQGNDLQFRDGRLRNAYASGELLDPTCRPSSGGQNSMGDFAPCSRLPGYWDDKHSVFVTDEYAAGTDVGNMAWTGLALIQADAILPNNHNHAYLEAARRIGRWVVSQARESDTLAGFSGGFEGFPRVDGTYDLKSVSPWRSTEHNIDLYAFFSHLAEVAAVSPAKDGTETTAYWKKQAEHAALFVQQMRVLSPDGGLIRMQAGDTGDRSKPRELDSNKLEAVPVDVQSWSALGMGRSSMFAPALDWAIQNCKSGMPNHGVDFNCLDGDGTWWEGTAHLATALRAIGREDLAAPVLDDLRGAQISAGNSAGALPAASKCGLTTGLKKAWRSTGKVTTSDWLYANDPHIGATAWYILAVLGKNPYYLAAGGAHAAK